MSTPGEHVVADGVNRLLDDYRLRCAWFLRNDYHPTNLEARLRVLDCVERHGDREGFTWDADRRPSEAEGFRVRVLRERRAFIEAEVRTSADGVRMLCQAAPDELRAALAEGGRLIFHPGRIRGALPQILA
jgi:hypothetical protein